MSAESLRQMIDHGYLPANLAEKIGGHVGQCLLVRTTTRKCMRSHCDSEHFGHYYEAFWSLGIISEGDVDIRQIGVLILPVDRWITLNVYETGFNYFTGKIEEGLPLADKSLIMEFSKGAHGGIIKLEFFVGDEEVGDVIKEYLTLREDQTPTYTPIRDSLLNVRRTCCQLHASGLSALLHNYWAPIVAEKTDEHVKVIDAIMEETKQKISPHINALKELGAVCQVENFKINIS